jgi:hypothetical protein
MSNFLLDNTPSILAYFSHSYRGDDRDVNLFFWKLFSENGFFFTIDPKSDAFVIPHLERLMKSSDCFIAVVTRRSEKVTHLGNILLPVPFTRSTHSPYIAFENFLAELADKPRLLFVENGLKLGVFGTDDCVYPFNRTILSRDENRFKEIVRSFAKTVRTYMSYNVQLAKPVNTSRAGIVIQESQDASGYTKELISQIQEVLNIGEYTCEVIPPRIQNGLQNFIRQLSNLELVVIDVCDPATTTDTLAVIQAKAIPCIRIAKFEPNNSLAELKSSGLLKDYFIGNDIPIILWKNPEELFTNLLLYLDKFKQARTPLDTYEQGYKYFKSAGRKPAKIFISNPGSLNPLALELVNELQTLNIQYFQYQSNSRIEVGSKWEEVLEQELQEFNIFVALINDDFHNSPHCQKDLKTAFERWQEDEVTILAYLCEETTVPELIKAIQFEEVQAFPHPKIVEMISKQIEKELYKKEDTQTKMPSPPNAKGSTDKQKILFLASNPAKTATLMLDEEMRSIHEKIRLSDFRDNLELISHGAARPDDFQQMLLETRPTIVHFSGHGTDDGEIILMDNNRQPKAVSADKLKSLFRILKDNIRVVVLNACYSKKQADAISEVIDFVIGMNITISDDAALAFSASFYRALGFGRTIPEAFDLGCNAIETSEEDTPVLIVRPGVDTSTARLIN